MLEYLTAIVLITLPPALFIIAVIFWYVLVTDRDVVLAVVERFGDSTYYYARKVVWITGASSGLGESMAYELASVGAKLILTARREQLLQKVKDTCLEKSKGKLTEDDILVIPFDITDLESHQKHVDSALAHFGKVDVLVNNAGQAQIGNIHSMPIEAIQDLFQVNVIGGIRLTQILLKHFLERNRGQIIVISSITGKIGTPCFAPYVATKHALQGFYDSLRMEYNNENIKVTIVNPGLFYSNIMKQAVEPNEKKVYDDDVGNFNQMTPKRCACLTLIAGANHLYEAWISYPPYLFLLSFSQHFPDMYKFILNNLIWSKSRLNTLLAGKFPKLAIPWKPLSLEKL